MNDLELCMQATESADLNEHADLMKLLRSGYALHESWGEKAADTIERQAKELDAGRELMRQAWHEFNAIRARDGAPEGVSHEWWSQMTEELGDLLADDSTPWMLGAARALLAPTERELQETQDAQRKVEQERDAALAEVERLKGELQTERAFADRPDR